MEGNQPDVIGSVRKHLGWLASIFCCFVLPLIFLNLPGIPVWRARMIAVSCLMFFLAIAIFWWALSPKTRMIRGGTLASSKYDAIRPRIELGMRISVVAFGIFFAFYVATPLLLDVIGIARGELPDRFPARVVYSTSGLGGVILGERSVQFERGGPSYYCFYSWTDPLRIAHEYDLTVLPRSKMILDFREIRSPGK
jgi:hypothetical protein